MWLRPSFAPLRCFCFRAGDNQFIAANSVINCATHSLDSNAVVVVAVDVLGAATQLGWMWWGGCSC